MKKIVLMIALIAASASTASAWTEVVTCDIKRNSVDYGTTATEKVSVSMRVDGAHNAETGVAKIVSSLAPSYDVVLEMLSSGRSDTLALQSSQGGKILALSSVDGQMTNSKIENKFVTSNGDYEITISCTTNAAANL